MDSEQPIDLLELFAPQDSVLGDFVRHIANKGLTRYRRFVQWGGKKGQPLYAHVIDLVFTLARLAGHRHVDASSQRPFSGLAGAAAFNAGGDVGGAVGFFRLPC